MLSISLVELTDVIITRQAKSHWPEELYPADFHQTQGTADTKGREFSVQFLSSFWQYRLHFPKDILSHRVLNKGEETYKNVLLELTLFLLVDILLETWRFLLHVYFHHSKCSTPYYPYTHHYCCVFLHFKKMPTLWSWSIYLSQGWHYSAGSHLKPHFFSFVVIDRQKNYLAQELLQL